MTEQTNADSNQTNDANETQDQSNDQTSIKDLLMKHSEVMAKLAEKPEEVNSEGLKHLGEQAKAIAEKIAVLESRVDEKSKNELDAMNELNVLKLELAKEKVMSKYGFSEDDSDLFDKFTNTEDMNSFAEKLSNKLKANAPKSRFQNLQKKEVEVPEHLEHLMK